MNNIQRVGWLFRMANSLLISEFYHHKCPPHTKHSNRNSLCYNIPCNFKEQRRFWWKHFFNVSYVATLMLKRLETIKTNVDQSSHCCSFVKHRTTKRILIDIRFECLVCFRHNAFCGTVNFYTLPSSSCASQYFYEYKAKFAMTSEGKLVACKSTNIFQSKGGTKMFYLNVKTMNFFAFVCRISSGFSLNTE